MQRIKQLTTVVGFALGGLACAGSEVPASRLADAEASIRAAEEVGAQGTPEAALQLKMANDRLQRAQALVAEGENDAAARQLEEARVSAELALLLARQEDAEAKAQQAEQRVSKLEQTQSGAKSAATGDAR